MTNESILISEVIPATPQRIFSAWMDSAEHSAFTGDEAIVVAEIGGEHRAAGGYIQGRTLELNEGSRIVQSWRTSEFPPESPDSRVEITLEPTLGGTLVTLLHTDIPVGQGDRYRQSWNDYYLSRLKSYFADVETTTESSSAGGMNVDVDLDEETSVGDLEPTSVAEAPTRVMKTKVRRALTAASRGAKAGSTGDTATVRMARASAAAPARSSKASAKPARAAARGGAAKKKSAKAKARRPAKAPVKVAARRAPARKSASGKAPRKAARRPVKKPASKPAMKRPAKTAAKKTAAKKMGSKAKGPAKKKASSSARSRR